MNEWEFRLHHLREWAEWTRQAAASTWPVAAAQAVGWMADVAEYHRRQQHYFAANLSDYLEKLWVRRH